MSRQVKKKTVYLYAYPNTYSKAGFGYLTSESEPQYQDKSYVLLGQKTINFRFDDSQLIGEMVDGIQKSTMEKKAIIQSQADDLIGKLLALPAPESDHEDPF